MKFRRKIASFMAAAMLISSVSLPSYADSNITAGVQYVTIEEKATPPVLPGTYSLEQIYDAVEREYGRASEGVASGVFSAEETNNATLLYMYNMLSYFYGDTATAKFDEMDAVAETIIADIDPSWPVQTKILYVNDYLTLNCQYDLALEKYSAYDCLVTKTAVCQGYAEAFWYLMYKLGINCRIVSSATVNHAWNVVQVGDFWYHVDTTWNDPVADVPGRSCHGYLLLSDAAIREKGHDADDWKYPYEGGISVGDVAEDDTYDEFFWKDVRVPVIILDNGYYFVSGDSISKADINNNITVIKSLEDFSWPVFNDPGYMYVGNFSGLCNYGDYLIYNDNQTIYTCDKNGGNEQAIYTLTAEQLQNGYIYGLMLSGTKLTYFVHTEPVGVGTSYTLSISNLSSIDIPSVSVTAGNACAALKWNAVDGAVKYRVFYRVNGTSTWTTTDTTATSATITGLTNGTKYDFLVLAYNGSVWSDWTGSDIKTATPVAPEVPAPATPAITVTAGNASVSVKWNAISGATKYRVYYRVNGASSWKTTDTTATSATITGLTNGTKYDFLVLAFNGSKWSEYTSSDIKTTTPVAPEVEAPAKPSFAVTAGNAQAVIKWSAVSGATKYRVYYRVNGASAWKTTDTTATSATITGLTNGTKYDFLVLAFNGSKWSEYTSSDIKTATPVAPAVVKPVVTATAGNGKVALKWKAVSGATQYKVYYYVDSKYYAVGSTTATSITVNNLTNGTKYGFLVRAYANGKWSSYTSADHVYATPTGTTTAKPVLSIATASKKAKLTWTSVKGATKYKVYYYADKKYTLVNTVTTRNCTVTGLTNGKKYGFLVRAYVNGKWTSYSSADLVLATPVSAKKPVVTATQGSKQVTLTWNAVAGATKYRVYYYLNGKYTVVDTKTSTTSIVKNLTSGTKYGFLVRAYVNGAWTTFTSSDLVYAIPKA